MSQNHQIGATWQSVWMNLINQSVTAYTEKRYTDAYQALQILFPWLPQECKTELQQSMNNIQKNVEKAGTMKGYYNNQITRIANNNLNLFLRQNLLIFSGEIQKSLENHKWIHREDNIAKPLYQKKGHL